MCHGYNQSALDDSIVAITRACNGRKDCNCIALDWKLLAQPPYPSAIPAGIEVSTYVFVNIIQSH